MKTHKIHSVSALNTELRNDYSFFIRTAKDAREIPFLKCLLPDGQRVNLGMNPLRNGQPRHRIAGQWDYCRKSLITKLKKAIIDNNVPRQKFLVKCHNIVNDDHAFCNYMNKFSSDFVSNKISFEVFESQYKEKVLSL